MENLTVYKGTDKDMKCRGMQYEIGKTEVSDDAIRCGNKGFHSCKMPIDVLKYYPPNDGNRFFVAEAGGKIDESSASDSKLASSELTLKAEIGIFGLVKAQIEWVKKTIGFDEAIARANESAEHSATGNQGAASATGDWGAASSTGTCGAASSTGTCGAASSTGYQGAASATGNQGAASATGDWGAASATGNQGAASATGNQGAASATGNKGAASATGTGGIAVASGYCGKVMGTVGCAIVCCERGEWNGETFPLIAVKAAIVDGEKIKADTWYTLKDGEFVEWTE